MQELIQSHSKHQGTIINTDGSVNTESNKCGWDFVAYQNSRRWEKSVAYFTMTLNKRMEIQTLTTALSWLSEQAVQNRTVAVKVVGCSFKQV